MFKGIIYNMGIIVEVLKKSEGIRIKICCDDLLDIKEGDSIAVDGVCLTLTKIEDRFLFFDIMNETVSLTKFKDVKKNEKVNIERSLKLGDTIDGHFVSGHVDCVGTISEIKVDGFAKIITIIADDSCLKQIVYKGSVALNGISLTIININDKSFSVSIIPKTLELTTFSLLKIGDPINIEVDMFSKYIQKYLENRGL
ncbi:riboflavin synthase [Spiroplasma endosymbiont of Aspidapion aeneum]|uniref:riboflavin synthase n=1 Tax=Spiroplasma endosymbiont of Aspidapion aeneum TaxID=3066276 RepID=UPI00313F2DA7